MRPQLLPRRREDHLAATAPLAPGRHTLELACHCDDPFGGTIDRVVVDIEPNRPISYDDEVRAALTAD